MEGGENEVGENEVGDGMQCMNHPHRNNNPGGGGGICALCLQEKLGKLLSDSSFPSPPFSSSSPPSNSSLPLSAKTDQYYTRSRLPFLVPNKKPSTSTSTSNTNTNTIFKRSKSTATPKRNQFLHDHDDFSPRKRNGFWSFLYPFSKEPKTFAPTGNPTSGKMSDHVIIMEEDKCLSSKVSRSRSVGCGSRSFSGDFFERISSGLGDCTLRRVESQREAKPKLAASSANHCIKERVRCGGIFGGLVTMTSYSFTTSSSSSSSSSSVDDARGKSWGWAFASPMRAFTTKGSSSSSSSSKRDASDNKNATPNLSAIPSLLTVRG